MVLKKRKRTAVGKMAMGKDYPKIRFEQAGYNDKYQSTYL